MSSPRNEALTRKQEGFVKDLVMTGNAMQAVLDNYDTEDKRTASAIASENLTKPNIIQAVEEVKRSLADRIPDTLLEQKHLELLNKLDATGQIDVHAVRSGLDMGYKLKGAYVPDKNPIVTVTINTTDIKVVNLAKEFEEKLKQNLDVA